MVFEKSAKRKRREAGKAEALRGISASSENTCKSEETLQTRALVTLVTICFNFLIKIWNFPWWQTYAVYNLNNKLL